jgi:DNA polymerase-1
LSGDAAMQATYLSGDPYDAFGVQSGLITPGMTEEERKTGRKQCKALVLGLVYGKGSRALAGDLKVDEDTAVAFVANFWRTFGQFKAWLDRVVQAAWCTRVMRTGSGWTQRVSARPNERSLRNWPIQSAGADILRRACCLLVEAGIAVCGPVHDAVLLEAPLGEVDAVAARAAGIMGDAAEAIIGHRIRVGVETFRYPDRYMDEHGATLWRLVWETLGVNPDALDPAAAAFDAGEPTPPGDRLGPAR